MFYRKVIDYLANWKIKPGRKPLVLRGARQVGKTCAVLLFVKDHFEDVVHINLDDIEHQRLFNHDMSLDDFTNVVRISLRKEIKPGKTLVFIDEIQNSLPMVRLLRDFYEKNPQIHVIAAGSLLEAKIQREGFSFPVGRVEFCYMYPLDFFEFLQAKQDNELLDFLKKISPDDNMPQALHEKALRAFFEYTMVGGMPEAVAGYIKDRDIQKIKTIYSSLITGYCEDVYKYSSLAQSKYLSFVIDNAPAFAGTTVTYDKFAGSAFRSREMAQAFSALEKVMILHQMRATKSGQLPLVEQDKRPKKLIYLDVGLVNYRMGIQGQYGDIKELNDFYRGRIAEQITGQNLAALVADEPMKIFYWARDKKEGMAEVDFCFVRRGRIVGVEVKSGSSGSLRSLAVFSQEAKTPVMARIYSGQLRQEILKAGTKTAQFVSLPFYLLPRIEDLLG